MFTLVILACLTAYGQAKESTVHLETRFDVRGMKSKMISKVRDDGRTVHLNHFPSVMMPSLDVIGGGSVHLEEDNTRRPTAHPTFSPSQSPTSVPTGSPTYFPTVTPSYSPSKSIQSRKPHSKAPKTGRPHTGKPHSMKPHAVPTAKPRIATTTKPHTTPTATPICSSGSPEGNGGRYSYIIPIMCTIRCNHVSDQSRIHYGEYCKAPRMAVCRRDACDSGLRLGRSEV